MYISIRITYPIPIIKSFAFKRGLWLGSVYYIIANAITQNSNKATLIWHTIKNASGQSKAAQDSLWCR